MHKKLLESFGALEGAWPPRRGQDWINPCKRGDSGGSGKGRFGRTRYGDGERQGGRWTERERILTKGGDMQGKGWGKRGMEKGRGREGGGLSD